MERAVLLLRYQNPGYPRAWRTEKWLTSSRTNLAKAANIRVGSKTNNNLARADSSRAAVVSTSPDSSSQVKADSMEAEASARP
jgi:hypothetical protein